MSLMRHVVPVAFLLLWTYPSGSAQDIELIESTPAGTVLNSPRIREAKDVWLEMINGAECSLDLEQFYVSNESGSALDDVLHAIMRAADRGVRVRLIVDARMYRTYPSTVDSLGKHRNCEARVIDFSKTAGGVQHAKYFIVDGYDVFVGSHNFDWRSLEHIQELGLRIRNAALADAYASVFENDWKAANGEPVAFSGGAMIPHVRLVVHPGDTATVSPTFSPKGWIPDSTLWDERVIVGLLDGAKHELVLQFLGDSTTVRKGGAYTVIDDALRRAARRGVKIRMLVADWEKGTAAEASLKRLSSEKNVEVAFSCIPEDPGGYIPFARVAHCKFIVADGARFWLGTSNCEWGYFYGSRNLGVVCSGRTLSRQIVSVFERSWDSPYRESISAHGHYSPRVHGEQGP